MFLKRRETGVEMRASKWAPKVKAEVKLTRQNPAGNAKRIANPPTPQSVHNTITQRPPQDPGGEFSGFVCVFKLQSREEKIERGRITTHKLGTRRAGNSAAPLWSWVLWVFLKAQSWSGRNIPLFSSSLQEDRRKMTSYKLVPGDGRKSGRWRDSPLPKRNKQKKKTHKTRQTSAALRSGIDKPGCFQGTTQTAGIRSFTARPERCRSSAKKYNLKNNDCK
nr:uncharacterized protein LOC125633415 [Caretta caretta]